MVWIFLLVLILFQLVPIESHLSKTNLDVTFDIEQLFLRTLQGENISISNFFFPHSCSFLFVTMHLLTMMEGLFSKGKGTGYSLVVQMLARRLKQYRKGIYGKAKICKL